ncbi:uncharacterized protein LOC122372666 [Amphibalanus amphitrite]|uniref:uncharacterized protein LOC122372666 n=1 Tax=Amphibalanus amphitrite TaxID=1232801 RepID=UPI001C90CC4D|nr:uncharacterized protein LOC122372666 [Amphibalanus amphitrite]
MSPSAVEPDAIGLSDVDERSGLQGATAAGVRVPSAPTGEALTAESPRSSCSGKDKPGPGVRGAGVLRATVAGGVLARAGRVVCGQRSHVAAARVGGYNDAEVFVSGYVQHKRVDWLLDTGAQCSVVSSDVIGDMDVQRIPALRQPVTVDGNALDLECVVVCDVSIGDKTLRDQPLFVVRGLSPSCILGTDLLKKMGSAVSIDFAAHTVSVRGCTVTEAADCVRSSDTVIIPPKHQSIVMCSVPDDVSGVVVVESSSLLSDKHSLLAARSVATVSKGGMIPVRVLNPSGRGVTLPARSVVARLMDHSKIADGDSGDECEIDDAWVNALVEGSDLSDDAQKTALSDLLSKHKQAFSLDGELGQCGIVKHSIPLVEGARPVSQPPRRINVIDRDDVDAAVLKMQRDGIIRPSCSPWSSPVVPVRKRDGSLRLCIDYRRLNDLTHGDSHPLPRVEDCLDALSGSSWFSVLDLQSGYWQQEVKDSDKEKTAFSTHTGLWEFSRMPFGLKGAPASFQRLMMAVLAGLTWRECLVYLDDVIVFGKSFDEALSHLDHVLCAVKEANLKLNLRKCSFFKEEVKFLGHVISGEGISADPSKVSAVVDYERPKNVHDVRRFIGLASYFRKFIPNFSTVAKPLLKLTEDRAKFLWDDMCESAFQSLKRLLTEAPVLAFPDFEKEFILTTDASGIGLGAILTQRVDDNQRDWDTVVPKVVFAYNTSKHETTGVSPFEIFHGRPARLPLDVTCGGGDCPADRICSPREFEEVRRKVAAAIEEAAAKRRQRQVVNQMQYQVGDRVWLHRAVGRKGLSPKLQSPWSGPFDIIEVLSPQNYRLRLKNGRKVVVHHDHLKPYVEREEYARKGSQDEQDEDDHGSQSESVDAGQVVEEDDDDYVPYLSQHRAPDVCIDHRADVLSGLEHANVEAPLLSSSTVADATDQEASVGAEGDTSVLHSADGGTVPDVDSRDGACVVVTDSVADGDDRLTTGGDGDTGTNAVRRSKRKRSAPKLYGEWLFS